MKFYTKEEGSAIIDTPGKIYRPERIQQTNSADKFHFWLTITLMAIFILLLFYSQKIQGLM